METNYQNQAVASALCEDSAACTAPLPEATSPSMRGVVGVLSELAHSPVPVLLIGEDGTGKRHIARSIHLNSGGAPENFLVRNCRELSAHELLPEALPQHATFYFFEIGDLNQDCQKRLLDLLSKQSTNGMSRIEIRVICASSRDLENEVRSGAFREDLYYRLSGVCLRIPPLRQRKEDIPQLMNFFLQRYSEAYRRPVPPLSPSTLRLFVDHSWPGNLPELEAVARAMVAVGDESVAMGGLRSLLTRPENGSNGQKLSLKEASRAASREAERELILKVLTKTRWNRRRAAQELQISYKALLYKLKQIGYGEYGPS